MSFVPNSPQAVQLHLELAAKIERERLETAAMQRHGYIAKIERISDDGLRELIEPLHSKEMNDG